MRMRRDQLSFLTFCDKSSWLKKAKQKKKTKPATAEITDRTRWVILPLLQTSVLTGTYDLYEFLVSKETVVLRRWERSKQKFGFIKRVDKGWITTVKDLESWHFER